MAPKLLGIKVSGSHLVPVIVRAALMRLITWPHWSIDQQLQRDSNLRMVEYQVLRMLSTSPQRTMRMSSLAEVTNASLRMHRHGAMIIFPRINTALARQPAWNDHLDRLRSVGVDLVYGEHVWSLAEPRTARPRDCPGPRS